MPFTHLHTHTEYSPLDGLSRTSEIVQEVVRHGQDAVSITDHGVCSGHPAHQRACNDAGVKPIFGIEAYWVPDRHSRENAKDYNHLILLAKNDTGLRNIWAMSTESFKTGFYRYPRMDWQLLEDHHEGVLALSGCLRGPLSVPIVNDDEDMTLARMARFLEIFKDDFYLEIQPNMLDDQIKVNKEIVSMGARYGLPVVSTVDSHYATCEAHESHRAWIAVQINKDLNDETDLFSGDLNLYVQSEDEVLKGYPYLDLAAVEESIANTALVAEKCNAALGAITRTPTYSKSGGYDRDAERLLEVCMENWSKTHGKRESQTVYMARFEREFKMLVDKGFCGYFLFVWDYVAYAKKNGVLVGPGRGSGGGSLVAYLCGITEIDPVESDLLFERFMTEGRTELPDFDVDFPASKRDFMQDYVMNKYGEDYVVRVGTHLRLKNKGIVDNLRRAMASQLPDDNYNDFRKVAAIIDEAEAGTAGLGLSWDDLWIIHEEELTPYRNKYAELFSMADRLVGRLKSYGKHAAGLVISSDAALTESIPLRGSEEAMMISQWEMNDLVAQGLVKFDFLTLRTLDTIQVCVDLLAARGININVYDWKDEYDDERVYDEIGVGHTLGIFQIETTAMTRLVKRMKPRNLAELADAITLVRPGPVRSGLTETYFRRRAGHEEVSVPHEWLTPVLAKTFGTMLYQEDIMATTMVLAGYNGNEADEVRSILGKKKVDKIPVAGAKFIERCAANGIGREISEPLWAQMAEFAKYSFNRAHAFAYALLGYWCAWLKVHYPLEFLTAALSTVDMERVPEFITECRRIGFNVLPPDVNESVRGFTCDLQTGTIRYGLDAIKGIGDKVLDAIIPNAPYADWDDWLARKGEKCNMGHMLLLAKVGAFDSLVPSRKGLVHKLQSEHSGDDKMCVWKVLGAEGAPNNLPCVFDWEGEPPEIGKSGKPLKKKDPPKRCTVRCRNYTPPEPLDMDIPDYTDDEVREFEHSMLGVYLSSTPFDRIPPEELALCSTYEDVDSGGPGNYLIAALLTKVKPWKDKNGKPMGFLGFMAQTGDIDVVTFSRTWERYSLDFEVGVLCIAEIKRERRNDDWSHNLVSFMPLR
jgi:DNA polymerase-3 subunit alpha